MSRELYQNTIMPFNFFANQNQNKTIVCKIIYGNTIDPHLSQILAGYQLLQDDGVLKYSTEYNPNYIKQNYIHNVLIEVNFSNGLRICYDLADGYQSFIDMPKFDAILDTVDFYFKRSCDFETNKSLKNKDKIKPLGFNYPVSCKNNPYDRFIYTSNNPIDYAKKYVFYWRNVKKYQPFYYYDKFENTPKEHDRKYKILYSVRLWNHQEITLESVQNGFPELELNDAKQVLDKLQSDWESVTNERIAQIRALKTTFGEQFLGGVIKNEYSLKIASDIIAPKEIVNRLNYLQLIKGDFVCIANRGLHKSIGWKFGEYIAASRAIITEPLAYEVVGDFKESKNYLTFNSTENLLNQTKYLLENPKIIFEIERNNHAYYNEHLRPDQLIITTLKTSGILNY